MIRCVLVASVALHVGLMAVLPNAPRGRAALPVSTSIVEVANEPPPPPKEEPPASETPAVTPPPVPARTAAVARAMPAITATSQSTATDDVGGAPSVDGDGPADFTGTVMSNAAPGPASKIVVNAAPPAPKPAEPKIVPVSSLSRRPGAPGLDAELERNYPIDARRAGIAGTAKLRVQILSDGRVGKVERVLESHPGFGDACTKTVRAARWEPPLDADGRAVATEIVYVCKFEVRS